MSLGAGFNTASAGIFSAFAVPVRFEPATGSAIDPVQAIYGQESAPSFDGPGATTRRSFWRVLQSVVASPKKGDVVVVGPVRWAVLDIIRHDDVGEFELTVEKTT